MAYDIVVYPDAEDQIRALAPEGRRAFDEALEVIALVPWNGRLYNTLKDVPTREWVFGSDGMGTVTYMVLEDQQRVDVVMVQWAG